MYACTRATISIGDVRGACLTRWIAYSFVAVLVVHANQLQRTEVARVVGLGVARTGCPTTAATAYLPRYARATPQPSMTPAGAAEPSTATRKW